MISETRNELLSILYMVKGNNKDAIKRNLDALLESFERDMKNKLEDLDRERIIINDDLELLEYVKENIKEEI
jgi:hypothetical protein